MNWDTNPFAIAWREKNAQKAQDPIALWKERNKRFQEMEYIEGEVEKLDECELDLIDQHD